MIKSSGDTQNPILTFLVKKQSIHIKKGERNIRTRGFVTSGQQNHRQDVVNDALPNLPWQVVRDYFFQIHTTFHLRLPQLSDNILQIS
jgi:hypothetical protein